MGENKIVGVIGGMGPLAAAEFFRRLILATPATCDQEHLHILVDNDPTVPNRTDAILRGGPDPVPKMIAMAKRLQAGGAGVLAMPCNTGHVFLERIRDAVDVPVLDMPGETAGAVREPCVGLLATTATIGTGLYHRACEGRDIELLVPDASDQELVMKAIYWIKASGETKAPQVWIDGVAGRLRARGAKALIAGCTELSLLSGEALSTPWYDALDYLVRATLREALG
ncbi:amino acid racemase [Candidatus Bipolaricaulota bacterium]|nr:amino acid racemase [Candidatus Bipolaricaulota bacterium]